MDWFTTIKDYYDTGLYGNEKVKLFVVKGKITPEQYEEITGETYTT